MAEKPRGAEGSPLGCIRSLILVQCDHKPQFPPGLLTLTVPTSGGKTLLSLVCVLRHAIENSINNCIIKEGEQNAWTIHYSSAAVVRLECHIAEHWDKIIHLDRYKSNMKNGRVSEIKRVTLRIDCREFAVVETTLERFQTIKHNIA